MVYEYGEKRLLTGIDEIRIGEKKTQNEKTEQIILIYVHAMNAKKREIQQIKQKTEVMRSTEDHNENATDNNNHIASTQRCKKEEQETEKKKRTTMYVTKSNFLNPNDGFIFHIVFSSLHTYTHSVTRCCSSLWCVVFVAMSTKRRTRTDLRRNDF